jgi:hypothetical protein
LSGPEKLVKRAFVKVEALASLAAIRFLRKCLPEEVTAICEGYHPAAKVRQIAKKAFAIPRSVRFLPDSTPPRLESGDLRSSRIKGNFHHSYSRLEMASNCLTI